MRPALLPQRAVPSDSHRVRGSYHQCSSPAGPNARSSPSLALPRKSPHPRRRAIHSAWRIPCCRHHSQPLQPSSAAEAQMLQKYSLQGRRRLGSPTPLCSRLHNSGHSAGAAPPQARAKANRRARYSPSLEEQAKGNSKSFPPPACENLPPSRRHPPARPRLQLRENESPPLIVHAPGPRHSPVG